MTKVNRQSAVKFVLLITVLIMAYFIFSNFKDVKEKPNWSEAASPSSSNNAIANVAAPFLADKQLVPVIAGQVSKNGSISVATTYRPGIQRAHKVIYANLLDFANSDKYANYWLYSLSPKDAQWLDQYGFPTPEEHNRLLKATDPELENLAKGGDMNAKAHLTVRMGLKAIATGNQGVATIAADGLLLEGGPYQAVTLVRGYKDMLDAFEKLPPTAKTDKLRGMMQYLDEKREDAVAMGIAYGDPSAELSVDELKINEKSKSLGVNSPGKGTSERGARLIASQASYRERYGLPPLIIVPRPSYRTDVTDGVIERY